MPLFSKYFTNDIHCKSYVSVWSLTGTPKIHSPYAKAGQQNCLCFNALHLQHGDFSKNDFIYKKLLAKMQFGIKLSKDLQYEPLLKLSDAILLHRPPFRVIQLTMRPF